MSFHTLIPSIVIIVDAACHNSPSFLFHRSGFNMCNETDYFYTLDNTNTLTFTDKGLKYYRALFAKAGINIRHIATLNQFENAVKASEPYLESHIYDRHKKRLSLESKTLIAILDGDQDKTNTLLDKIKRKKELGLSVLKGQ